MRHVIEMDPVCHFSSLGGGEGLMPGAAYQRYADYRITGITYQRM